MSSSSSQSWLLAAILIFMFAAIAMARGSSLRTSVFLSPPFIMEPGSVVNKFYYDVDFPRGHIAIKSLDAEVVDEAGNSVPLHETYLHHWVIVRYYGLKETEPPTKTIGWEHGLPRAIPARNAGVCNNTLSQYFGLGSETRRTLTWVPDPYGIEAGNPGGGVPYGYEERWMLNVHAIDTRGAADRLGCTECRCDLYDVTADEHGRPLGEGYVGGLFCCYDKTRCRVEQGFVGGDAVPRKLYMKYTVKWVGWDDGGGVVSVKIYILDVTGSVDGSRCKVEYEVESCGLAGAAAGDCIDNKRTRLIMPRGGDIVYGVSHQHTGGLGAALYGQDGRLLCSSMPVYGEGEEAGNEAGYIVGMSTCYPTAGSASIADGEVVTLESNYSSAQMHTGVMGFFYLLVADKQPSKYQSIASTISSNERCGFFQWRDSASPLVASPATGRLNLGTPIEQQARDTPQLDVLCQCGAGWCIILKAEEGEHTGRKYFACPRKKSDEKCDFTQWCVDLDVTGKSMKKPVNQDLRSPLSNTDNIQYPLCACGAGRCRLLTMEHGEYAGRKYFGCTIKKGQGACNFFQWQNAVEGEHSSGKNHLVGDNNQHPDSVREPRSLCNHLVGNNNQHPDSVREPRSLCNVKPTLLNFDDMEVGGTNVGPPPTFERRQWEAGGLLDQNHHTSSHNFSLDHSPKPGKCYRCGREGHWVKDCVEHLPPPQNVGK